MKFLVIGLGSMGKRRVRNLIALGVNISNICGFDSREDRRKEAHEKYNIEVYTSFDEAIDLFSPDAVIISTPPDLHMLYAHMVFDLKIHMFIEASVVDSEKILELHEKSDNSNVLIAPSCTYKYFPLAKKIKEIVDNGLIGKVLNVNYQTGQYLPDWHPWEKVDDFYVGNKNTGGCREIVPFEMTWLNDIFGEPIPLSCTRRKLTDMNVEIEDIYHFILEYPNQTIANMTVEVISRPEATREIRILGERGLISYSGDSNILKFKNLDSKDWLMFEFGKGTVEKEYINPEEPYIEEIIDFVESIKLVSDGKKSIFPNTLLKDYYVLNILYKLEEISEGFNDLSR